jgi:hypothetical protein
MGGDIAPRKTILRKGESTGNELLIRVISGKMTESLENNTK